MLWLKKLENTLQETLLPIIKAAKEAILEEITKIQNYENLYRMDLETVRDMIDKTADDQERRVHRGSLANMNTNSYS